MLLSRVPCQHCITQSNKGADEWNAETNNHQVAKWRPQILQIRRRLDERCWVVFFCPVLESRLKCYRLKFLLLQSGWLRGLAWFWSTLYIICFLCTWLMNVDRRSDWSFYDKPWRVRHVPSWCTDESDFHSYFSRRRNLLFFFCLHYAINSCYYTFTNVFLMQKPSRVMQTLLQEWTKTSGRQAEATDC